MAINSKINPVNLKGKFPALYAYYENSSLEFIVLFIDNHSGTVVYSRPEVERRLGYYSDSWVMESSFVLYNGSITLENE